MIKAAIVGYGFVGKATEYLLRHSDIEIVIHDPMQNMEIKKSEWADFKYAIFCLPTPIKPNSGKWSKTALDTSIINMMRDLILKHNPDIQIIVRSTVGPDQVSQFPEADIMPEFLREKNWKEDVDNPELPIIFGTNKGTAFLDDCHFPDKRVIVCEREIASMYKLARNAALAMRVALANDFFDICVENNINYEVLAKMLSEDKEGIGGSHWAVPGPDGKLGFGGNCFPKDLTHIAELCYNTHNPMKEALAQNIIRRSKNEFN
jgi:UDP-glucose 6-dehydrogenase